MNGRNSFQFCLFCSDMPVRVLISSFIALTYRITDGIVLILEKKDRIRDVEEVLEIIQQNADIYFPIAYNEYIYLHMII